MGNDVTWWKQKRQDDTRNQNEKAQGIEVPGDTDAPDIVGRTGEEMPEVAHDDGHHDDERQPRSGRGRETGRG